MNALESLPVPRISGAPLPPEERELIEGLRQGDEAAYRTLVVEHGPRMLSVARRYLEVEQDAEDALQSAFLSVFRYVGRFRGGCRLSTWLHRVVANAALMQVRTRRRYHEVALAGRRDAASHGTAAKASLDSADAALLDGDERRRVACAMRRLPPVPRAAVSLHHGQDLVLSEVASLMDKSVPSVRNALRRGRSALRSLLEPSVGPTSRRGPPRAPHVGSPTADLLARN